MKTYKKLIKRKIQSMLKISVTIAVITGLIGFISGMMQGAAFAVSLNSGLISALLGFLNPACIFIFEDFLLSRRSVRSLSLPLLFTIRILLYLAVGIVMYTIVGIAFLFVKKLSVSITEKYTNTSATVLLSCGTKWKNLYCRLMNVLLKFFPTLMTIKITFLKCMILIYGFPWAFIPVQLQSARLGLTVKK